MSPTSRFDLLLDAVRLCLRRAYRPGAPAARMHLFASSLRWPGDHQPGLFEPPREQAEAVGRLKRAVNAQVGRFALRSGTTLFLSEVYRDSAQSYDICDVRGKMCF
jgi:DNA polymerase V